MRETLFVRSSFLNFVLISVINIRNQNTVEVPNVTKASAQPGMRTQFLLISCTFTYTQTHICTVRLEGRGEELMIGENFSFKTVIY